ncbi:MAG: Proteic killer system protein suppressor of inhibitory function of MazF [Pseudomonadota bacterium]
MLTTMRQIGNSRGVLIPAAFLALCQIEDQVDMQLQDGKIVIQPVKRELRAGWFASEKSEMAKENSSAWDVATTFLADDSEWVW